MGPFIHFITYTNPLMRRLYFIVIIAGICLPLSCTKEGPQEETGAPDMSRFSYKVLAEDLDEPMVIDISREGVIYIAERYGNIWGYDEERDTLFSAGHIDVNTKYTSAEGRVTEAEEGLIGLSLDPDFSNNNLVYIYYAHPVEKKHLLTRWEMEDGVLKEGSEIVMLEVETQRETCCHTGGGMTWDAAGNLYLTVGNNTGNNISAHTDEREGRSSWDDQGHAANTNDLRGKILRIHPEPDGSYTIPEGNLFPPGTEKTRPEIYAMGLRNPWRVSLDSETGFIYWGEVGPDATADSEVGPKGYDELNQARNPGNFGWPFFVGPNAPFPYFDYEEGVPLEPKDPDHYTNHSVNNTGLELLPPVEKPFIYYPYGFSEEFPLVGSGSRSATGGPVFRKADFEADAPYLFPDYFEGKWIATDLMRGWIMAISMEENGDYSEMEQIFGDYAPIEPIDMRFGPDGGLYVLEYGSTWFAKSPDSKLVRIEYNRGNRPPVAVMESDRLESGSLPMEVSLDGRSSYDPDGDEIQIEWRITDDAGGERTFTGDRAEIRFDDFGVFHGTMIVSDVHGAQSVRTFKVVSGNTPPEVEIEILGNRSFYFPEVAVPYRIRVEDEEDGSLEDRTIDEGDIYGSIQYISDGYDLAEMIQQHRSGGSSEGINIAVSLMDKNNCNSCHNADKASIGPSLVEVSRKYHGEPGARTVLNEKIRQGGSGVWGTTVMPANPALSQNDADLILDYILNITEDKRDQIPVAGEFVPVVPEEDGGFGSYVLMASYSDRSVNGVPSNFREDLVVLRSPNISFEFVDEYENADVVTNPRSGRKIIKPFDGGFVVLKGIDLTGISSIEVHGSATQREENAGGRIDFRLDGVNGRSIGSGEIRDALATSGVRLLRLEEALAETDGDRAAAEKLVTESRQAYRRAVAEAQRTVVRLTEPVDEVHDLYLVFSNEAAGANQSLFTMNGLKFNID